MINYVLPLPLDPKMYWLAGEVIEKEQMFFQINLRTRQNQIVPWEGLGFRILYETETLAVEKRYVLDFSNVEVKINRLYLTGFINIGKVDESLVLVNFEIQSMADAENYKNQKFEHCLPKMLFRNS